MIRRILVMGAIACAAVAVSLAAPASAQTYTGCTATLSDTTPSAGQVITVSGTAPHGGVTVGAFIGSTLIGSGVAAANGDFSFSATIPSGATGTITVDVNCNVNNPNAEVLGIQITVGGGGGELVVTGSNDTFPLTKMAIALITVGGIALAVSRRRSAAVARSDSRT